MVLLYNLTDFLCYSNERQKTMSNQPITSITVGQALNMKPVLEALSQLRGMQPAVAYRLARFLVKLQPEFAAFETARQSLVQQLGVEAPLPEGAPQNAKNYTVSDHNMAEFNSQVQAMMGETIEMPKNFTPLTQADIAVAGLAPVEIIVLFPIMDQDEELPDPVEQVTEAQNNSSV